MRNWANAFKIALTLEADWQADVLSWNRSSTLNHARNIKLAQALIKHGHPKRGIHASSWQAARKKKIDLSLSCGLQ